MKLIYPLLLSLPLLLTACHSSKNATRAKLPKSEVSTITIPGPNKQQALETTKRVANLKLTTSGLTATTKVRLTGIGGKELSVNGKLQMLRNKVVRISLRFLGMEVGLMEFTPSNVLVIDRMNKQYVRAAYTDVSFLRQASLDFYSLQALFWNELFLPGEHQLQAADLHRFSVSSETNQTVLQPTNTPRLTYRFFTDPSNETIHRLQVKSTNKADRGEFAFNYDSFERFSGRPFPTDLQMAVTGTGKKDITLSLNLSSLKATTDIEPSTTVSSKYTQRSVQEVLGKLEM